MQAFRLDWLAGQGNISNMGVNLVTGGAGFIGTHLVERLRAAGEEVRVLDLDEPLRAVDGAEYLQGSVADRGSVDRAVAGCRRVFHLAAISALWTRDRSDYETVNVGGTRNVLEAARKHDVETVVHTSTESILISARSDRRREQWITESTEPDPAQMAGPYCESKLRAEAEALDAAAQGGPRVVVCTPTVPVGPGDPRLTPPTDMLLGFLNRRFPAWMASTLNLVDARDVADGHVLAAEHGESGARYLLGGHDVPMAELLAALSRLTGVTMPRIRVPYPVALASAHVSEWLADRFTGRPPPAPLTGVRLSGVPVRFDNRRTRAALGWNPRPLEDSLRDAIDDFVERGLFTRPGSS